MEFEILYDSHSYAPKTFIPIFLALLFIIIGVIILRQKTGSDTGPKVMIAVGTILIMFLILGYISDRKNVIQPYLDGDYEIVEGYPVDFEYAESFSGNDYFYIDGELFILGATRAPGLQQTAYQGGPIDSEDKYYRITYISFGENNYIFKVEILVESN